LGFHPIQRLSHSLDGVFSNLNTVNESYHQCVKDIEETLIKMEELKEFNLLDYKITSKEINTTIVFWHA
jgi:hypothetical protein